MNVRIGSSVSSRKFSLNPSYRGTAAAMAAEGNVSAPRDRSSLRRDVLRVLAANVLLLLAFALWQSYALQQLETLNTQKQTLQQLRAGLASGEGSGTPAEVGAVPAPEKLIARMNAAQAEGLEDPRQQGALRAEADRAVTALDMRIESLSRHMRVAVGLLILAMLLLQAGALWGFRRQVVQPLVALAGRAERVAAGLTDDMTPLQSTRREFRLIAQALDGVGEREARLAELVHRDETTGLANRRAARQSDEQVRNLLHHGASSVANLRQEYLHGSSERRRERVFENLSATAERDGL